MTVESSVFSSNTASGAPSSCPPGWNTFYSGGHNVSDTPVTDCSSFTQPSDLNGADPLLDGLRDNGGLFASMALMQGSPAIGQGGESCPTSDQRRNGRTVGPDCDSGAFEAGAAAITTPVALNLMDDAASVNSKSWAWTCTVPGCTYRFAIDNSSTWAPAGPFGSVVSATRNSGDGTYYLHVQAQAGGVDSPVVTVSAEIDTTAPNTPASLGWVQASPSLTTTITAQWALSTSTDLFHQRVHFYDDATCTHEAEWRHDVYDLTQTTEDFTGVSGGTYTYQVDTIDIAGNEDTSVCSPPITIQ